jgi:hypothetical protein
MWKQRSIQFKAAFLAIVFGLNPIIGFACSINIDMGFNSKDHHQEEAIEAVVHIHEDGERHIHYEKKDDHSKAGHHQHRSTVPSKDEKDNCCTDRVKQVEQLDKSLPHSFNLVHPIFSIAFFDVFYNISLPETIIVKNIKQFVRCYHPPIPGIRIAIQSFQI